MFKNAVVRTACAAIRPAVAFRAPVSTASTIRVPAFVPMTRHAVRAYSSEPPKEEVKEKEEEKKKTTKEEEKGKAGEGEQEDELTQVKKKLEAKEKEALEFKDCYLRSVADFQNLQNRSAREMKAARDFAIQKFAKDLIDSVDNLDRALTMVPEHKRTTPATSPTAPAAEFATDLANLYEGLKMTEDILVNTLKKHGLERFDPMGLKFDPNEHDATFMAPQEGKEDNEVFHVQQKGFKLNGRVLRAAKVGVVKNA